MTGKHPCKLFATFLACLFVLMPSLLAESLDKEAIAQALRQSFVWLDNVSLEAFVTHWYATTPQEMVHVDTIYYEDQNKRVRLIEDIKGVDRITGEPVGDESNSRENYRDRIFTPETQGFLLEALGKDPMRDLYIYENGPEEAEYSMQVLVHAYFNKGEHIKGALKPENIKSVSSGDLDGEPSVILEIERFNEPLTLWLSPQDGYTMQKWRGVREVEIDSETEEGAAPAEKKVEKRVREFVFSDKENIQGHIVPMKIESVYYTEVDDKIEIQWEDKAVFSNVQIAPDFDAMGAFELPDYSHIERSPLFKADGSIIAAYRWKDGDLELLFEEEEVDGEIKMALEGFQKQKEETTEKAPEMLRLSTAATDATEDSGSSRTVIVMLLALTLVVGAAGLGMYYWRKGIGDRG